MLIDENRASIILSMTALSNLAILGFRILSRQMDFTKRRITEQFRTVRTAIEAHP